MSTIKVSSNIVSALVHQDELPEGYELVESGEWVSAGKYEYSEHVFKFEGRFYQVDASRSGSYFSDWHYSYNDSDTHDAVEVEQVPITKMIWRAK